MDYRQDLIILLEPNEAFRPEIDSLKNSNGIRDNKETKITWKRGQYEKIKTVHLPFNSRFLLILRVYAKDASLPEISNDLKQFITLDCVQPELLTTYNFKCIKSNQSINANSLCDGKDDCLNSYDEDSIVCRGGESFLVKMIKYGVLGHCILGIIVVIGIWIAFKKRKNISKLDELSFAKVTEEVIPAVMSVMSGDAKNLAIQKLSDIYKRNHDLGKHHTRLTLQVAVDTCRKEGKNEKAAKVIDLLLNLEYEIHSSKDRSCLKQILEKDYATAKFILDIADRNSCSGKILRQLEGKLENKLGNARYDGILNLSIILFIMIKAVVKVVFASVDDMADASVFSALKHVQNAFITDKSKLSAISNIDIDNSKYTYLLGGWLTHSITHLLSMLHVLKVNKLNNLLGKKLACVITVIFPLHALIFAHARESVMEVQEEEKIKRCFEDNKSENTDTEHIGETYMQLQNSIKVRTKYRDSLRYVILRIAIIELILEGLPQSIQLLGFLINEYLHSHGKLVQIYGDTIKNYFGINGKSLIIVLMAFQALKLAWTTLQIHVDRTYPLGFGFVGSILVMLANGSFIMARMFDMSIGFLTMPYVYYLVALMELILVLCYRKMIGGGMELSNDVLASTISSAHFRINDSECCYKHLQKWDGLPHKIILHVLTMILIHIPTRVFLSYTSLYEDHANPLGNDIQLITIGIYFLAIVPFFALTLIRLYLFNAWNLVGKEVKPEITETNDTRTATEEGKRFVDPFDPQKTSFMEMNLEQVQSKLVKNNN